MKNERTPKQVAMAMLNSGSKERKTAEYMFGKNFLDLSIEERRIAATILSAFDGIWQDITKH